MGQLLSDTVKEKLKVKSSTLSKDLLLPHEVDDKLWKVFRLAVKGGLEKPDSPISPDEIALLFDNINVLVTAFHSGEIFSWPSLNTEGRPRE